MRSVVYTKKICTLEIFEFQKLFFLNFSRFPNKFCQPNFSYRMLLVIIDIILRTSVRKPCLEIDTYLGYAQFDVEMLGHLLYYLAFIRHAYTLCYSNIDEMQ